MRVNFAAETRYSSDNFILISWQEMLSMLLLLLVLYTRLAHTQLCQNVAGDLYRGDPDLARSVSLSLSDAVDYDDKSDEQGKLLYS